MTTNDQFQSSELSIDQKKALIEKLMNEYGQQLLWLAYSYVRDKGLAEDIIQEVFLAVYNNIHKFRGEASIKTWIYRITANKSKDIVKSLSFRTMKVHQFVLQIIDSKTPEDYLITEIEDQQLTENILRLSIPFREVIILYYFEELTVIEIAKLLNLKENTVKSRLSRARSKLKEGYERSNRYGK